jgi:hypothetical protein
MVMGISDIINRNLVKFNISITKNLLTLFKILQITNQVAYVTRDYQAVLPFIEDACKKIEATERTKDKHFMIIYRFFVLLANTYFRIKKRAFGWLSGYNAFKFEFGKKKYSSFLSTIRIVKKV